MTEAAAGGVTVGTVAYASRLPLTATAMTSIAVPTPVPMRLFYRSLAACFALALAVASCAPARPTASVPAAAPSEVIATPTNGIPARLSDTEFWSLINQVSEPGGYFRSDNILSNEILFQTVIPRLLETTRRGDIYLGVGPEQNLTYIAALEPKMAIIFDIRRGNLHMHMLYKALFELSADRAEFLSRLFSKPRPAWLGSSVSVDSLFNSYWYVATDSALYRRNLAAVKDHLVRTHGFALTADDLAGIDYVYDAFYYGGPSITYSYPRAPQAQYPNYADLMVQNDGVGMQRSYLASDAIFRRLKDLQTRNLIVPVVGDFGGPSAIRAVGDWLRARDAVVGAIYVSNVEQYLFQGDAWRRYYESVATLPIDSTTTFIRSVGGQFGGGGGGGGLRLPSVLSSVEALIAEYRAGRINAYYDVIRISR